MKRGIQKVLGKTISGIVVAENDREPKIQMFLTFTDGTYFEIWGNNFNCCSELDRGGVTEVKDYAESQGATIQEILVMTKKELARKKSENLMTLQERMYTDLLLTPFLRNILAKKGFTQKDPSKK